VAARKPPFAYTAQQWALIRAELPKKRAPASNPQWATVPLRLPAIVYSPSPGGRPRGKRWARRALESAARTFLDLETAASERRRQRPNRQEILRTVNHLIALLMKAPDAAFKANAHAEFATQAEAWAAAETWAAAIGARGRGASVDTYRDWLFERLLFIWEECGGATHVSVDRGGGGPLVRFLRAACDPVLECSGRRRKTLTEHQARGAVRKLLQERRPK
jgi:hypothetical protein